MDEFQSQGDKAHTLFKELHKVLGQYTPSGDATVFVHAGSSAEFVALHESAHRDLVCNTVYGWLLQFLISDNYRSLRGGDSVADPGAQAEAMISASWNVLEGHATYIELLHIASRKGAEAALAEWASLPASYRAALDEFASQEPLGHEGMALYYILLISAMAEYAMDRCIASLPVQLTDATVLYDFPDSYTSYPDRDLQLVYAIGAELAGARKLSLLFHSVDLEQILNAQHAEQLTDASLMLRRAIEQIKLNLFAFDPEKNNLERGLFTANGLRSFLSGLMKEGTHPPPDAYARSLFINDGVEIKNDPATRIATDRVEVSFSQLPMMPDCTRPIGANDVLVGSSLDALASLFAELLAPLDNDAQDKIWDEIASKEGTRVINGQRHYSVEVSISEYVTVPGSTDTDPPAHRLEMRRHFLAYGSAAQIASYWRKLAQELPGQCCWLGPTSNTKTQLRVPDVRSIPLPCILQVSEYGHDSFVRIAKLIGKADYFSQVELGNGFHAVLTGINAGPVFLLIGAGDAEVAGHFAPLVGQSATDAADISDELLSSALAAVWVVFKSVFP